MRNILMAGMAMTIAFIFGTLFLGSVLEGYNPVSQTVSEIGQNGSPLAYQFLILGLLVSALEMIFGSALMLFGRRYQMSIWPGIFILLFGLSDLGTTLFPSPHPLHNVFGLSMTIGYFAPLVFAIAWRKEISSRFRSISFAAFILVILGIFLNLTPAFAPNLYPLEYYGLVQRFLLYTFFLYGGYVSWSTVRYSAIRR